jgi:hypothetical protein
VSEALPRIRGYRILELIGRGGMGEVFLAQDEALDRRVAIKRIAAPLTGEAAARSRFLREARAMAGIEHPHVVRVYALGEAEGQPYVVMEYVPGVTLAARLARGPLGLEEALRIAREVTQALDAAWSRGIVHRDVKPANILLDRQDHAKVADFGLARLPREGDPEATGSGTVVGTAHYISPEQARGEEVDFRSDVYSLGIVLYERLGGRKPFTGRSPMEVMARQLSDSLPPLREARPDVPSELATLVESMTAKIPAARPASYRELLRRLTAPRPSDGALESATSTMPPVRGPAMPGRKATRRAFRWLAAGATLALVGTALLLAPSLGRTRHGSFTVAVAPFYGADPESEREGRVLTALVESELARRLPEEELEVLGVKDVGRVVRTPRAARELVRKLDADVLVWGEALAFQGEVELAARITRRDGAFLEVAGPEQALAASAPLALRRARAAAVVDTVAQSYRSR